VVEVDHQPASEQMGPLPTLRWLSRIEMEHVEAYCPEAPALQAGLKPTPN
jgi:hypothetical protein